MKDKLQSLLTSLPGKNGILYFTKGLLPTISIWNPEIGILLSTVINSCEFNLSEASKEKLEDRLMLLMKTINKIIENQQDNELNYQANLFCPDLFREALLIENREKAIEHLKIAEMLFSSGNIDFDEIKQAIKIINNLTSNEYKILKIIPTDEFHQIGKVVDEFILPQIPNIERIDLNSILYSLKYQNLIEINQALQFGGNATINFDSDFSLCISKYGEKFLKTVNEI